MQHLHRFLVRFEEFAGELAEDGQIGEVRWRRCVWGLTKLLEHKLYAVPAQRKHTLLTQKSAKEKNKSK